VQPLSSFIQHAHTLSKVQYLAAAMSLKSLGFIKWWPRCLYLHVARAYQSKRMCQAVSDVCLHLSH